MLNFCVVLVRPLRDLMELGVWLLFIDGMTHLGRQPHLADYDRKNTLRMLLLQELLFLWAQHDVDVGRDRGQFRT